MRDGDEQTGERQLVAGCSCWLTLAWGQRIPRDLCLPPPVVPSLRSETDAPPDQP